MRMKICGNLEFQNTRSSVLSAAEEEWSLEEAVCEEAAENTLLLEGWVESKTYFSGPEGI